MTVITSEIIDSEELDQYELPKKRKINMYVDNIKLTEVMNAWSIKVAEAKSTNKMIPLIPEFVGKCILLIAENLAKKGNFSGYSWADEMIDDGVIACCAYLHNYKPDAVTRGGAPNPYGYISFIIERAFKHRIEIENRQLYFKNVSLRLLGGIEAFEGEEFEDAGSVNDMMRDMLDRAHDYEEKQKLKAIEFKEKMALKKPKQQSLLDLFAQQPEEELEELY